MNWNSKKGSVEISITAQVDSYTSDSRGDPAIWIYANIDNSYLIICLVKLRQPDVAYGFDLFSFDAWVLNGSI